MNKRLIPILILIAYIALLIDVMVFKNIPTIRIGQLMLNFGGTDANGHANFLPFTTIVPYLLGKGGWIIAGINLVGNIAPLVPLGFIIPFVYPKMTWKKSLILAIVSGLTIETMQTVLRVGIFDIDDIILNALGVMMGYWVFIIIAKWMREKRYINILIAALLVIAAVAGAVYFIYPWGQALVNPRVGVGGTGGGDEGGIPQSGDLCGGTGGTGQIISEGSSTITIKRNDGVIQPIKINNQTTIKNSAGPLSESDLKIGDRVTIVIENDSQGAIAVLVCGE